MCLIVLRGLRLYYPGHILKAKPYHMQGKMVRHTTDESRAATTVALKLISNSEAIFSGTDSKTEVQPL